MNMNKMNILLAITISMILSVAPIEAAQQKSKTEQSAAASIATGAPAAAVNPAGQQSNDVVVRRVIVQPFKELNFVNEDADRKIDKTKDDQDIREKLSRISTLIIDKKREEALLVLQGMNNDTLENLLSLPIYLDAIAMKCFGTLLRLAILYDCMDILKFILHKKPQAIKQEELIIQSCNEEYPDLEVRKEPIIFTALVCDIKRGKGPFITQALLEHDNSIVDSVFLDPQVRVITRKGGNKKLIYTSKEPEKLTFKNVIRSYKISHGVWNKLYNALAKYIEPKKNCCEQCVIL
jgi:hypothetical protein